MTWSPNRVADASKFWFFATTYHAAWTQRGFFDRLCLSELQMHNFYTGAEQLGSISPSALWTAFTTPWDQRPVKQPKPATFQTVSRRGEKAASAESLASTIKEVSCHRTESEMRWQSYIFFLWYQPGGFGLLPWFDAAPTWLTETLREKGKQLFRRRTHEHQTWRRSNLAH